MSKYLSLLPILLITVGAASAINSPIDKIPPKTSVIAIDDTSAPEKIARQITVKVQAGNRRGSGTIIAKRGNQYTVLTNAHVANRGQSLVITTTDGQTYQTRCLSGCTGTPTNDIALLEFTAAQNYTVPKWADLQQIQPGETVYSAGFPFEQPSIQIISSKITVLAPKPLQGGYQIGYGKRTDQGMSGGPLLNATGQLLGIIGFNSQPILNEGYQYQDGTQPLAAVRQQMRKSSFAIPITLAQLDSRAVPTTTARAIAPNQGYTGTVKRVDAIAQQITVRVEDSQGNGSGVIIGKSGNTYSVITAAHVIKGGASYSLITPTQERIALSANQMRVLNKDLDIALIEFTSSQNYATAELANYQFRKNDWVFVSGFPARDTTRRRQLSIGGIYNREETEFEVKDQSSLSNGNDLVYNNLSLPGMSGGAILDRQGKLVGINTGAENEQIITKDNRQEEINFGYSLGIPTSTILGLLSQGQVPAPQLKVTTILPPALLAGEGREIKQNQLAALSTPNQTSTAKEWLDYGNLLWRSLQHPPSTVAFDRAVSLLQRGDKDQLKLAYFGKGLALKSQNKQKEAILAFQQALTIDPQFLQALRYQGQSFWSLRQYDRALNNYQKAIELDRQNFALYIESGNVLRFLKRYPDAINSYNQAIVIQPNQPRAYNDRGVAYFNLKRYPQATADYEQAIKIDPQYAAAYNNRGVVSAELKQYPQAIADYNRAIEINPQYIIAYSNRGDTYRDLEQYPQAIVDYGQAIKLAPQSAQAYYSRGNVHRKLKQYPQAISDYGQAIKIAPKVALTYNNRGFTYNDLKQYSLAIIDYDQAIALNSKNPTYYENRGIAYVNSKQYSQALADYNQAIKLKPQSAGIYNRRGVAYFNLNQYPQALADYNEAIGIEPKFAIAYGNRGDIYRGLKQYDRAIADYNQAISLSPKYANAYYIRGIAYRQTNQSNLSKADWEKAAQLYQQQGDLPNYQAMMKLLQKLAQSPS